MEFMICATCGRFHLTDGKRLIGEDGKAQPIECKCINSKVMTVKKWLEDICRWEFFNSEVRRLIKTHNLYEFAFGCVDEPYCEQYSQRIKDAIVDVCFFVDMDKLSKLLEDDKKLLKEFYVKIDVRKSKERFKVREE